MLLGLVLPSRVLTHFLSLTVCPHTHIHTVSTKVKQLVSDMHLLNISSNGYDLPAVKYGREIMTNYIWDIK